ncbi:MAG: hypothetical protein NTU91_08790 [Chloroflexi bacterium]|nr:hypothetical protein [Chloroflexota bacterium]
MLLLIGAGVTWLTRRQVDRVSWGLATAFALLAWLSVLFILPALPTGVELSAWRPASLFASRLEINLDRTSWGIVYAVATGLLAVFLTGAARPALGAAGSRSMMLAYTALALLAIMAGNLLSVAILWMTIDVLSFLYLIARVEDPAGAQTLVGRLAIDMSGTVLVLAAAAASFVGTLELPFGARPVALLPAAFLALAVLLRLGLLPLNFTPSPLPQVRRGLGTLLRMLPPAAAMAVLARTLGEAVPSAMSPWLLLAGALGSVVGSVRWFMAPEPIRSRTSLVLSIAGVGLVSAVNLPSGAGHALAISAAVMVTVVVIVSLTEIRTPWHRMWPLLGCVLLIGLPWTAGGALMAGIVPISLTPLTGFGAVLGLVSMVLVIGGLAREALRAVEPWPAGETMVKSLYGLGLALPPLALAGYGILLGQSLTLPGIAGLLAVVLGLAYGWWRRDRLETRRVQRWTRLLSWLDAAPVYAAVWRVYRATMAAVRAIGEALEGEGAFLWVLVALLAVALVVQGGSP